MVVSKVNILLLILLSSVYAACAQEHGPMVDDHASAAIHDEVKRIKLPKIDLSHWKVTIPEGSGKGGAVSVEPPVGVR